jgi:hypothetical protein
VAQRRQHPSLYDLDTGLDGGFGLTRRLHRVGRVRNKG